MKQGLTIGYLAERTGLAVSAIRFYEEKGLIAPVRNSSGHRRYDRSDIRRLSFIKIAQELGFPLADISARLEVLPPNQTLTKAHWQRLSKAFRVDLNDRITKLEKLRDTLDGCIGCGCLSLQACALYNPQDIARKNGSGPRYLIDENPDVPRQHRHPS
ncbi:MAG: redox-sensitive transcriptional activator SoxR [Litoreibacter sp.]